jgi:hypothetical protein
MRYAESEFFTCPLSEASRKAWDVRGPYILALLTRSGHSGSYVLCAARPDALRAIRNHHGGQQSRKNLAAGEPLHMLSAPRVSSFPLASDGGTT